MHQNGRPSKGSNLLKRAYRLLKKDLRLIDRSTFENMIRAQKSREDYEKEMEDDASRAVGE